MGLGDFKEWQARDNILYRQCQEAENAFKVLNRIHKETGTKESGKASDDSIARINDAEWTLIREPVSTLDGLRQKLPMVLKVAGHELDDPEDDVHLSDSSFCLASLLRDFQAMLGPIEPFAYSVPIPELAKQYKAVNDMARAAGDQEDKLEKLGKELHEIEDRLFSSQSNTLQELMIKCSVANDRDIPAWNNSIIKDLEKLSGVKLDPALSPAA